VFIPRIDKLFSEKQVSLHNITHVSRIVCGGIRIALEYDA
jgi:hypothetical protein